MSSLQYSTDTIFMRKGDKRDEIILKIESIKKGL